MICLKPRRQLLCAFAFIAVACHKGNLRVSDAQGSGGPPAEVAGLSILNQNCVACHGMQTGGQGGVSDILNVSKLIADGLVVPGSPESSPLFLQVESGNMPPTGPLSAEDIETLRLWIAEDLAAATPSPTSQPTPLPTPGATPLPPTPQPTPPAAPTYQYLYQNIFLPKCVSCHGSTGAPKGIRLDSYSETIKNVDTANPQNSPIYVVTDTGVMPPAGPLTIVEVQAILNWISAGAPNN